MKRTLFPTVIIDDFFSDPDYWRDLALAQEFQPHVHGKWPGQRTDTLEKIDTGAYGILKSKILSIFNNELPNAKLESLFQRIPSDGNVGWIHTDAPVLASIVIYLNKNYDPLAGTSLYKQNSIAQPTHNTEKMSGYLFGTDVSDFKEHNNEQWTLDIAVPNRYNRMVLFDSSVPHTESKFSTLDGEDRLTLVSFLYDVDTTRALPLLRVSQCEF